MQNGSPLSLPPLKVGFDLKRLPSDEGRIELAVCCPCAYSGGKGRQREGTLTLSALPPCLSSWELGVSQLSKLLSVYLPFPHRPELQKPFLSPPYFSPSHLVLQAQAFHVSLSLWHRILRLFLVVRADTWVGRD